jgi:ubiquinone/menaquinone biosynthesis C-methylase UbiE
MLIIKINKFSEPADGGDELSNFNERDELRRNQYKTAANLNSRVLLHQLYSTNKLGLANWIFQHYALKPNQSILELGCGNGGTWNSKRNSIPRDVKIVLSDFSEGMLTAAKDNLIGLDSMEYEIIDAQFINYNDNTFDIVIANHMLYHVPDIKKALGEISRVLKPNGIFYASTNSINNMEELTILLHNFDSGIDFATNSIGQAFGLETGKEKLSEFFRTVEVERYDDSLHITEVQPLVDYVLSSQGIGNVNEIIVGDKEIDFTNYITELLALKGCIDIKKGVGMFISSNPIK